MTMSFSRANALSVAVPPQVAVYSAGSSLSPFTRRSCPAARVGGVKEFPEHTDSLPAAPVSDWTRLRVGQPVTVTEEGRSACTGIIDNLTPDASILWISLTGLSPRRMFLCSDPVKVQPAD
jgi:hypothetical protein